MFSGAIDVPESSTGKRMSLSHDGPVPKRPKVTEGTFKLQNICCSFLILSLEWMFVCLAIQR